MSEYSKLSIALEYLEAAIEERELHRRYFAAMNLAGVAEEILGKIIRSTGQKDQLTRSIEILEKAQEIASEHLGWNKQDRRGLKKLLGSGKNGIKHMDSISDINAKLHFVVEDESKWHIQNAICNLDILKIAPSRVVMDFSERYRE